MRTEVPAGAVARPRFAVVCLKVFQSLQSVDLGKRAPTIGGMPRRTAGPPRPRSSSLRKCELFPYLVLEYLNLSLLSSSVSVLTPNAHHFLRSLVIYRPGTATSVQN